MEENMTQLTKAEQEHIITQFAPTIQRICKHYTNGFYYPNDLPTPMRLQFTETMEGFHRSYGNRIARSLMAGCMEYEDFDSIVQSVATVDVSERKRLANVIRATNRQVQQYHALTKLSDVSSFLFISEQSDTTCDRCMSRHGQLYRIEDLQSGTDIPALHSNCQCALVALDMTMTLQYNQNKHWFVNQMTEMVAGHSGLLQMSGNGILSQIMISDDGTPQIYHLIDNDVAIGAMSLSLSVDRFVQWAMEFGGDAANLVDTIIARGRMQMLHAAEELTYNPIYAVALFADALTGTIASAISETIVSLLVDFSEDITPYNLLNLLTFGWLDTTNHALNPEEMWSFQHFMDMIGSVTFLFGAIFGAPIAADQLKDIFSRHIDDVASGSVDDVLDNIVDSPISVNSLETQASVVKKLESYLLDETHLSGGSKAKWFREALGFTQENLGDLAKQIIFDEQQAVPTIRTEYGTKYNQYIKIIGANGNVIDVKFVWIREQSGVVRLITAIPTKNRRNIMFHELDVIRCKYPLGISVPAGCTGTIVMVYSDRDYEVEFMMGDETVDVMTVSADDIELI